MEGKKKRARALPEEGDGGPSKKHALRAGGTAVAAVPRSTLGTVRRTRGDEKKAARVEAADQDKPPVSAYLDCSPQVLGFINRPDCSVSCGCRRQRLNLKRLQRGALKSLLQQRLMPR